MFSSIIHAFVIFFTVKKRFSFQLLSLQINAEKYFFGIRKSLVEFDEVLEVRSGLLAHESLIHFTVLFSFKALFDFFLRYRSLPYAYLSGFKQFRYYCQHVVIT